MAQDMPTANAACGAFRSVPTASPSRVYSWPTDMYTGLRGRASNHRSGNHQAARSTSVLGEPLELEVRSHRDGERATRSGVSGGVKGWRWQLGRLRKAHREGIVVVNPRPCRHRDRPQHVLHLPLCEWRGSWGVRASDSGVRVA